MILSSQSTSNFTHVKYRIVHFLSAQEVKIITQNLSGSGIEVEMLEPGSSIEFIGAVQAFAPDLILTGPALSPSYISRTLQLLKANQLCVPVLMLTDSVSEEIAQLLLEGAEEYILMGHLKRLAPAVINAVEKFRCEGESKRVIDQFYAKEELHRASLKELSTKISLATREAALSIWEYQIGDNIFVADDLLLEQFEISQEEFKNNYQKLVDKVFVEDRDEVVRKLTEYYRQGIDFSIEYRLLLHDGSFRYMKTVGVLSGPTQHNPTSIIGTCQDITADKISQKKISDNEARLASAQALAKIGSWETDMLTFDVIWSEQTCRIFGIPECGNDTSHHEFLNFVHPDDKVMVDKAFKDSMLTKSENILEHRILTVDGELKFVEERWHFVQSEQGDFLKAIGTIQDITQSKLTDQLMKEGEMKYRSMVESSMDAILLTLKTGEILAANEAACIYFKMTEEELCNAQRSDIVEVTDPNLKKLLQERDITGRAKGELIFIRKDQTKFPGEVSSVVFTNADGEERCSVTIRDISNRKQSDEKIQRTSNDLKEALNGLNKIMNSSLDVICAVDAQGYFMKVSAASEAVWGYKPEEMIGKPLIDFVYKEDNASTQATANNVMKGKRVNHFENRYVKKDGTLVPIEWTARWDEKDQVRYGVARDVTEKKRLQKAFEDERVRFQDIFLQAPCVMGTLKGKDYIFETANNFCQQFLGEPAIIGKPFSGVVPDAKEQGFIKILDMVYASGETYSAFEKRMIINNEVDGNRAEKYVDVIVQVLRNLAGEAEGVFFFAIDVTAQVISRRQNEESEKKYRQIVEMAQEGIWVTDHTNRTTFVNDKMCEIFGYTRSEMIGQDSFFLLPEEPRQVADGRPHNLPADKSGQFYQRYVSRSGKEIWAYVSVTPLQDESGEYAGALAMLTDMTEIKRAEELIKISEKRYRTLFEQNLAGFYQSTLDGKIIHCNDAFARMLLYGSANELLHVKAADLYFTVEDRSEFISKVGMNKQLHNYEGVLKKKDGSPLYYLENVSVQGDPANGVEYFDGIIIDITEKKEAELQLKESNERFVQVSNATFDVIWDWDVKNDILYLGERFKELFGYEVTDKAGGLSIWSDHIHPQDKERVLKTFQSKIDKADGNAWVEEYRYICADGRVASVLNRSIFIKDGSFRMIGAMQDITDIKELENLLHKATSLAQIGSWEYIVSKDELYLSDVTRQIHGIPKDIAPGLSSIINYYKEGENKQLIKKQVKEALQHGTSWDTELIIIANGEEKWIRIIGETEMTNGACTKIYGSLQDIHLRKMSELALTEAFNEKDTILESIGDAFFAVDNNWNVNYWNSQAEKILEAKKSDIIGKNLWEVFSASVGSLSYNKYTEALKTGELALFEDYSEGLNKWYEISAYPSQHGLSVYFKDITDRKLTDAAVRASEQVRRLVMDSAMDGIICIDVEGHITVWNPQAEKIFGWTEEDVLGKLLSDTVIPVHLRDGYRRGMQTYLTSGYGPLLRKPFESVALHANGVEFPVELSIVPIQQGDTEFFCAFIRDISARKISEAHLSELHRNLLEQSKKLQISNEELEKYAYVTSHDLQEPLRMVTSFLQLLQEKYEGQLDDTAQKYIKFAVDGAGRMKMLILDLLEFSRISSVQEEHTVISLKEIVSKTLLSLKSAIDETHALIYVPDLPDVPGNEFQLLQLFQNLLSNALKYRGDKDPVIEIGFSESESHRQFSIKDNGIGIDPRFYDKIFIIFQRLHNKKNFEGTGIGLAICKKIVELHNGKIWVESDGEGTTFYFTLQKEIREKNILEIFN